MQIHATLAVWRLSALLLRSRSPAPCAVPLSQPGALRYPASHHLVPSAVSLSDPLAPRAISHRGAPCAVRHSQPGVMRCNRNAAERCVRESAATP
eukprot:5188174-Pleurochrysis_carterae.AAC.1